MRETGFSPASQVALDHSVLLARDRNAQLLLLHVHEPSPVYGDGPNYAVPEPAQADVEQQLRAVQVNTRLRVDRRVMVGYPAEQILAPAAKEHADVIIIGTHGRTGLMRLLMGSVAECVVRGATCPVLEFKAATPLAAQA